MSLPDTPYRVPWLPFAVAITGLLIYWCILYPHNTGSYTGRTVWGVRRTFDVVKSLTNGWIHLRFCRTFSMVLAPWGVLVLCWCSVPGNTSTVRSMVSGAGTGMVPGTL